MKLGDMIREGWSFEQLAEAGWEPAHNAHQDYAVAGFRLRALTGREEGLARVAERVRECGDEDLVAAHRLGGGQAVADLLKAEGTL